MSVDNRSRGLARRGFLRGMGAAALSSPFLRAFEAHAQGGPKPKLLIFASPNGNLVGPMNGGGVAGWLPTALQGGGTGQRAMRLTEASDLPPIMSPLSRHLRDLLPIEGLRGDPSTPAHQHAAVMLTGDGVYRNEPSRSGGGDGEWYGNRASIDQIIASRIESRVLGLSFKIQGFQLGEGYISYTGANRGHTPIQDPAQAFERVFGSTDTTTVRAHRGSVLDTVLADAAALQRRLPAADQQRLEQHLEGVRAIERDLEAPVCGGGTAPGAYNPRRDENMPRVMRDHIGTMVQAMACGYTRVGFIQAANLGGNVRANWPDLGIESTATDHAIAHSFAGTSGGLGDTLNRADAIRFALGIQRAYNRVFAQILDALAETPDVDGNPMLDHTFVLHVKAQGVNHNSNRLMWIAAGGRRLGVNTGRFLRLAQGGGSHHINDLLVSIAHLMGVGGIEQVGRPALNRTPIDLS